MAAKPRTIDEYLATAPDDQRAALEKLRKLIKSIVPDAEECINYGVAAFRLDGQCIAGLGASKSHCSYYPMSGSIIAQLKPQLKAYHTSKGCIRFQAQKPLPAALVRKLIKARLKEIQSN